MRSEVPREEKEANLRYCLYLSILASIFIVVFISGTNARANLDESTLKRLICCYKSELAKKDTGEKKYELGLQHFSSNEKYKLFIDQLRLANPKPEERNSPPHLLFDVREPGYYDSMISAFELMSHSLGKPITLELLILFHDQAVSKIPNMKKGTAQDWKLHLDPKRVELEALEELLNSGVLYSPGKIL